jgi:hypothetical protein
MPGLRLNVTTVVGGDNHEFVGRLPRDAPSLNGRPRLFFGPQPSGP